LVSFISFLVIESGKDDEWLENQLFTGAEPYSSCFNNSAGCYGDNCSSILVTAGNEDVVVMVKNQNDLIVSHSYIKSFDTVTIKLINGYYQTFFYSGIGWNPDKVQDSDICRDLRGGFVRSESFSKDNQHNLLNNNVLTYKLLKVTSGNFRPNKSSAGETF